ncbi:unnamed protein product [Paramecium sonneborni]|uniref:Uncharacterized protein n=1 Tax=Paramecium sonneborni TaxID=65129 RepID=A0A8S1R010_9CILI|nr:unnamed protein product [Paramecium sonneborni]
MLKFKPFQVQQEDYINFNLINLLYFETFHLQMANKLFRLENEMILCKLFF